MEEVDRQLKDLDIRQSSDEDDEVLQGKNGGPNNMSIHKRQLKSGSLTTAADKIVHVIDWTHFYVFIGRNRRPAEYNDLCLSDFVYGFLAMVRRLKQGQERQEQIMLRMLGDLMQDATKYGLEEARSFFRELLINIESDRLSWEYQEEIRDLRREHFLGCQKVVQNKEHDKTSQYCALYQWGKCDLAYEHRSSKGIVKHFCSYCWREHRSQHLHPECACRKKKDSESKNEGKGLGDKFKK